MAGGSYPVSELARIAGVTVRTLHHYDEIGLLRPSARSAAGYRSYDDADVDRLQRVLAYRELGFGLAEIAELLDRDGPAGTALEHLRAQHRLIRERVDRLQRVLATLETTMEAITMGIELTPAERLEVFGPDDPARYADEVQERWGDADAWEQSRRRTSGYTKQDWLAITAEVRELEQRYAAAMAAGLPPDSVEAMDAAAAQRDQISRRFYDLTPAAHAALAELYVQDERFARHYEDVAAGLVLYIRDAVLADVARATGGPGGG